MITSSGDTRTARLHDGERPKGLPPEVLRVAWRKLDILNNARTLDELRVPPGNRLEALKGDKRGLYSIRVNDQWRIVFQWQDGHAAHVILVDYH